jgi:hypothetical protein
VDFFFAAFFAAIDDSCENGVMMNCFTNINPRPRDVAHRTTISP